MTQNTPQSTQHAEGSNIAQAQGPGAIANVITNIFRGSTAEQRALRNRQTMLQLVRNTWIKGVLEQSLHGAAMIELGLEERADAVERPWDMVLQMPDQPNRQLPPGTKIVDVFDEMNQSLLILGEPGAGKTTMLLELARDTIARAEQDPMQPIPVVFNLSSWTEKRQPIAEWLVEELNTKYNIPKKIACPWIENDDLLLLLDGLDEVTLEHQEDCARAINDFCQEHLVLLVVCSRVEEYEALTTRLKFQGAVLLQPLTPQQVDEHLGSASTELLAVREILHNDTALQTLAQTPLMLSIITTAYQDASIENLKTLDSTDVHRRHLFDAYVRRMFERRRVNQPYSREQTVHWLAWLAQKVSEHNQTVFLIEQIQPSWLSTRIWRWLYMFVSRTISMLAVQPAYFYVLWLWSRLLVGYDRGNLYNSFLGELDLGSMLAFILLLVSAVVNGLGVGMNHTLQFERRCNSQSHMIWLPLGCLFPGVIGGLIGGIVGGVIGGSNDKLLEGLVIGLGIGLIAGFTNFYMFLFLIVLVFGSRGKQRNFTNDIQSAESLEWSWRRAIKGGCWGLILTLLSSPGLLLLGQVRVTTIFSSGIIFGLVGVAFGGLSSKAVTVNVKTIPNQGIRQSVRNSLLAGLIFGAIGLSLFSAL